LQYEEHIHALCLAVQRRVGVRVAHAFCPGPLDIPRLPARSIQLRKVQSSTSSSTTTLSHSFQPALRTVYVQELFLDGFMYELLRST
jgi:hypothetical protein